MASTCGCKGESAAAQAFDWQDAEYLADAGTLLERVERCRREEEPLERLVVSKVDLSGQDFFRMEARQCKFEGCSFEGCLLDRADLTDVLFEGCNLTGVRFAEGFLSRCQLRGCKGVGLTMDGTVLKDTSLAGTSLCYAALDRVRMTNVTFREVDCTEATISEARLKGFQTNGSRFIRTSFFKTSLKGVDFTTGELLGPLVSDPPVELRGIRVNLAQAAGLVGLLGVEVEV